MKTLYFLAALLLLSACAPQKYQTRYAYLPPAGQSGVVCIQRCGTQQNQCKQRFSALANQCQQRAQQQARREMPGRIAAYETALAVWEKRIERYERDRRLYELHSHNYSIIGELGGGKHRHGKHNNGKHPGKPNGKTRDKPKKARHRSHSRLHWRTGLWLDKPNYPGKAPRRPTLPSVTAEIVAKNCPQQNQCGVNYNQCYTACGGRVKPYQVLLRN